MKKMIFFLLLLAGSCRLVAREVHIEVKVNGERPTAGFTLYWGADWSLDSVLARGEVRGESLVFDFDCTEPTSCLLVCEEEELSLEPFEFLVGPGETVSVDLTCLPADGPSGKHLQRAVVKGSAWNDRREQKLAPLRTIDSLCALPDVASAAMRQQVDSLWYKNDLEALTALYQTEAYRNYKQSEIADRLRKKRVARRIIEENKADWWGPYLAISLAAYGNELWKSFPLFSEEARRSSYGRQVAEYVRTMEERGIGKPVTSFEVQDKDGKRVSVKQLLAGHKYLLLDFWASWCAPCRASFPKLKALYTQYHAKGLEIVSISIEKKKETWEKALQQEQLPWPNFLDREDIHRLFNVEGIPAMFLIDENGILIQEYIFENELENLLMELFSEE